MKRLIRAGLVLFGLFTLFTGLIYPLAITAIAQGLFPQQANGSLITVDGKVVGSQLIGQQFTDPKYFWGRLSDTPGASYNAASSGGSNLSVLNPDLKTQVEERLAALKAADPGNNQPVPVDLVTASASGLDPDISVAAAEYQAARVARLRNLPLATVQALIRQNTQGRFWGLFGEPRVNVLALNLALDRLQ